jgi:capsular polysaccharide biosynthesis protein
MRRPLADRPDLRQVISPSRYRSQRPLLWLDGMPPSLVEIHDRDLPLPSFDVYPVSDAQIFGDGWVMADGTIVFNDEIYPGYLRLLLADGTFEALPDTALEPIEVDRCFTVWHPNCVVYGHWLIEAVPKLFGIRLLLDDTTDYGDVALAMPADAPSFAFRAIEAILPDVAIVRITMRQRLVASQVLMLATTRISLQSDVIAAAITAYASARMNEPNPSGLFVSRLRASDYRRLVNLAEVEAVAVDRGLSTLYPEQHSFEDQVRAFANARVIVGEYGSGLHNAMFAPAGTVVVALNWINQAQSRIAQQFGHRVGYILPSHGGPAMFTRGEALRDYAIDVDDFARRLDFVLT